MPVLCGSAFKNKGVQPLLDAVVDYLPAPTDVAAIKGVKMGSDEPIVRRASDDEPFAGLAFKIMSRPVCRLADLYPHLFRRAQYRRAGAEHGQEQRASGSAACC